jgi:hypothetical protein
MPADDKRYRFVLMETDTGAERLPVRYRRYRAYQPPPPLVPRPNDPMGALLEAFAFLERRGTGFEAWAPALADNPLAFLLDTLDEAVMLRDARSGRVVYKNRAARRLPLPEREQPAAAPPPGAANSEPADEPEGQTARRKMSFRWGRLNLELEVLRVR